MGSFLVDTLPLTLFHVAVVKSIYLGCRHNGRLS
jgi:hypothetical protein